MWAVPLCLIAKLVNTMTYSAYSLTQEPSQFTYERILDFSLNLSSRMLLVIGKSMESSDKCNQVIVNLDKYLLEKKESSEWPGTILYAETASVRTYSYNKELIGVVKSITASLYEWNLPDLPEDFCLLRDESTPWLVTISHEKDGYFYATQSEIDSLIESVPELEKFLVKD
jgi:hypothetical protein